jgi:very-short-patch-repair endonuclease
MSSPLEKLLRQARNEKWEALLAQQISALGMPQPVKQYRFHESRQWKFDFAYPDRKLAVEIDGLSKNPGAHQRFAGIENDCEKRAEALIRGWKILRVTGAMVKSGRAVNYLRHLLNGEVI